MAQIHDRKSNFYSQKQSVRDEVSALQYLESAGDELIKCLVKKQTSTSTSLQEQLEIVQNFEKGFELNPDTQKGISSLADFKKLIPTEHETSTSLTKEEKTQDINELVKITGLSRHELELTLCEKPNSSVSQLYMFAIGNKRQKHKCETLENKLLDHPINHLKDIEEECFGRTKKSKINLETVTTGADEDRKLKGKTRTKKKQRKRKKKACKNTVGGIPGKKFQNFEFESSEKSIEGRDKIITEASPSRPSLWDVKDMKKWSEFKTVGCKPQTFYTIKNGKIIKLENDVVEKAMRGEK